MLVVCLRVPTPINCATVTFYQEIGDVETAYVIQRNSEDLTHFCAILWFFQGASLYDGMDLSSQF